MKKKYIIFGMAAFSALSMKAQKTDTAFKKETVNKTEIEILYSHYIQDGNNSAVTGGTGTEKLTVYAPGFRLKKSGNNHSFNIKGGVDVISSASTDNIDYVVSSASRTDFRGYANFEYTHEFKNGMAISGGTGFSIESDYFSFPINAGLRGTNKNKMRTWSFDIQLVLDDLRYGIFSSSSSKPRSLIYPSELRYREWYDEYRRRSYNVKFGITQVINKRMIVGIYPEINYQHGLLATPFHRVYFNDNSLKPEQLPSDRFKGILGIKTNSFAGSKTILKNGLDLYIDNFGVFGIALENETAVKLNYLVTLSPSLRFYHQEASKYFAPFQQHIASEKFYTSDYDLSGFNSFKAGMGFRYAPYKKIGRRYAFNDVQLRYAYYQRSNRLKAHIISFVFSAERLHRKRFVLE